jgi:hypothetical protein
MNKVIELFNTLKTPKVDLPELKLDYQTYNLWCVEDVTIDYECTDEQALEVLEAALTNDSTMDHIWYAINFHAEDMGLKRKEEEEDCESYFYETCLVENDLHITNYMYGQWGHVSVLVDDCNVIVTIEQTLLY